MASVCSTDALLNRTEIIPLTLSHQIWLNIHCTDSAGLGASTLLAVSIPLNVALTAFAQIPNSKLSMFAIITCVKYLHNTADFLAFIPMVAC